MLLMGLAGCSAIDVILILKKQKQNIQDFRLKVDGMREKRCYAQPVPENSYYVPAKR